LPFTEPLKHGFITFQIKTKNNLVIGDSLKNYADIFFDYNLPITTNTAGSRIDTFTRTGGITSIRSNTNKEGKLSIYPNPSHDFIEIQAFNYPISNLEITDMSGLVLKSWTFAENTRMDISEIQAGSYLLKANTSNGVFAQKLIVQ